jgi:hypothetical protein
MKQLTLAMVGFERYAKPTRRATFLAEMERIVPWSALCGLIEPFYPKLGNGRPPVGVERMLRLYFLQQWFNLSDPAVEEALYDSLVMRQFVGIDLGREPVPDETTVPLPPPARGARSGPHAGLGQVQLEPADILRRRGIGRAIEKRGKPFAAVNVAPLRARRELPRVHVFDHAMPQWSDGARAHEKLLSWMRLTTPRSFKTGRPSRYRRSLSWFPRPQCAHPPQQIIAERFSALAPSVTALPQMIFPELRADRP